MRQELHGSILLVSLFACLIGTEQLIGWKLWKHYWFGFSHRIQCWNFDVRKHLVGSWRIELSSHIKLLILSAHSSNSSPFCSVVVKVWRLRANSFIKIHIFPSFKAAVSTLEAKGAAFERESTKRATSIGGIFQKTPTKKQCLKLASQV